VTSGCTIDISNPLEMNVPASDSRIASGDAVYSVSMVDKVTVVSFLDDKVVGPLFEDEAVVGCWKRS